MLIAVIACLFGDYWYTQPLPATAFVCAVFALGTLLVSFCLIFISSERGGSASSGNTVLIVRAAVMSVVLLLAIISGILFAIGVEVCLREAYGTCYLFYYSKPFVVASVSFIPFTFNRIPPQSF
ncbi:unnamed protein product [Anisakis simplex]|uniref:Transmembrane protein n=1 Tax=Anisakis simplex TaxID=6269 RepID=A0A0M3JCZ9_ANISI|nr:unnamed protein product [Anisakis simplex]